MALTNTPFISLKSLHPSSHHRLAPSFKPSSLPTTKLHLKSSIKPFSSLKIMNATQPWTVDSWKSKKALQLPVYPNEQELKKVLETLKESPPLVFAGEARTLEQSLAEAARGNAFLLQGGDCAESFKEFSANKYRDTFRVLLQMAVILMYGAQVPVVKVGRMAGQFAKPRSDSFEEKGGVMLPSYRGDIINGDAFTEEERIPDPNRLLRAYNQSAATMNLLGAFSRGGYASFERIADWKLDFLKGEQRVRYENLAEKIDDALGFLKAMSRFNVNDPVLNMTEFWTSHECLLLPYEQQLTREDSTMEGSFYDCSAHMVWVGERTRQLDGAHVEFMRGISNPIGIKVSDKMDPDDLIELINILNPNNKPGRITIIVRMGAEKLRVKFPSLIRAVGESEQIVTWVSDPMHGNTIKAPCGLKTRSFDSIMDEIRAFFEIHEEEGSVPGGIHLEMTGQNVTECVGGTNTVNFDDLNLRYHTHCDPRLNNSQSLELAFLVSDLLKRRRINRP